MQLNFSPDDLDQLASLVAQKVLDKFERTPAPEARMTETEASQLLRVQPCTLREARRTGKLRFERVGRYVRYTQAHLDEWLRNGEPSPA